MVSDSPTNAVFSLAVAVVATEQDQTIREMLLHLLDAMGRQNKDCDQFL